MKTLLLRRLFPLSLLLVTLLPVTAVAQVAQAGAVEPLASPRTQAPSLSDPPGSPGQDRPETGPAAGAGQPGALDFNLFDEPSKPSALAEPSKPSLLAPTAGDASVEALAHTRRHRLQVHQVLGLTTWGLMLAACVVGQLNYGNLYGSGGSGSGAYILPHEILVYSTAMAFVATAGYALFAPKPYAKPLKLDTGLLHRVAVLGASAGMVAQMVLGFVTARTADAGNPYNLERNATAHAVLGWTTFGLMTVAAASWVF